MRTKYNFTWKTLKCSFKPQSVCSTSKDHGSARPDNHLFNACHANTLFFKSRGKLLLSLPRGSGLLSLEEELSWDLLLCLLLSRLQAVNTNVLGVDFLSFFLSLSFLLTHPDFSKLPRSKFLHHLNRIFGNLPGVFVPRLLSFGFYTRAVQFSTQAICFVWEVHHKDAENYFIPALMFKTHVIPLKRKVNYFHLRTSWRILTADLLFLV